MPSLKSIVRTYPITDTITVTAQYLPIPQDTENSGSYMAGVRFIFSIPCEKERIGRELCDNTHNALGESLRPSWGMNHSDSSDYPQNHRTREITFYGGNYRKAYEDAVKETNQALEVLRAVAANYQVTTRAALDDCPFEAGETI